MIENTANKKTSPRFGMHSGQASAEFAIVAFAFLALLFGIIECALATYSYNTIAYTAREATRWAAVRGATSTTPAQSSDVTNFVLSEANGLNPHKLMVNTTWSPDNKPGSYVTVQVQYQFNFVAPFVSLKPVTMTSTSQMVISY
jgi:Flp pilus assembly protein TadG